ncbi:hypothetical protein GGS23DRAFT_605791 [Durotheca rogersii]|uniref:uncharacterized protein n=1 Tax=Durotheca rogersii TaxID=419775 RepID=UPI00221FA452|nr:uncharacterized protein GGS23DRAFT_605791 [Durotheca rogersii]KAI5862168.1 hypothetical protein GGS23DRAFT_605791 [Durotheca rogersii]
MVRFWNCAIAGCPNAAAIDIGDCERCESMYCATHIRSVLHICEKEPLDDEAWLAAQTAELVALNQKTNHAAILRRAKELSGGLECRLDDEDLLGRRQMGGMHIHLQLIFENGTVWLVRILREKHTSFDDELSNQILLSECATLWWLESVDVPTPRLHGYGLRGDPRNEVGVAYMIIDKLPGRPFNSSEASERQRSKVLGQWADVLCILGKHPLDKIGSLMFDADGAVEVGPIASDRTGTLPCIGPFEDAKDFHSTWAETYLELIADGQLFSPYSIDAYLMFKFLAEQAKAGPWLKKWQGLNLGPFFLKHVDDKGDHILIDDDFRITGIIDWSFARAVPAYEAFGPSLVSADTTNLFTGRPGLSEEDGVLGRELQRRGAPHCYFESDEMRRFLFGPGMGLDLTKDEAIDVFRGLVATFDGATPDWQEWRRASLIKWENDARLVALCQASLGAMPLGAPIHAVSTPEVPRFETCSWSNCGRPSVRGRSCQTCMRHLCAVHILPRHHKCPSTAFVDDTTWEMSINSEVEALLTQVDVPELVRVASSLRNGKPCKFYPGKHLGSGAMMGCANYHCWIVFDDGVKWLARIPRTTAFSDIPPDLVDYLVESEYATLKFLEHLGVPAPKAHGFGLSSDPGNLVGIGYILEDAMPGRPFYADQATAEQKSHVYNQYAEILIAISRLSREQACSLLTHGEETREGAIASNRFLSLGKHGPFADPLEYFTSIADLHLDLIADGQLYPEYPKEAYLFYRLLRDRAAPTLAAATASTGGFFLKHVDDKGDHLLVDENYNITAVIDWQFARFVPACEAFGPSLFTADLSNLYSPLAELSADDRLLAESLRRRGREDIAEFASESELARRFHFGLASGLSRSEALGMIRAVLSLLDGEASEEGLREWIEKEWGQAAGDPRREKVEKLMAELEKERLEDNTG